MVTIKDVAAAAGVSPSTASRALNDKGSISPKVRAQIKKVAKELNYLPNEMARSLQTKRTHMIGVVAHRVDKPFFGRLVQSIERRCYENDYKLLLCTTGGNVDRENSFAMMFDANKLDGAILAGWVDYDSDFMDMTLPVVTVERYIADAIPMITSDNIGGGRLAARTLQERGCTCAAMFMSSGVSMEERYQGFSEECGRLGLRQIRLEVPALEELDGNELTFFEELIRNHPEVDGYFGVDEHALLCRDVCRSLGYKIPEQIQIVGYDGLDLSSQYHMTTIAQPIEQIGALAYDLLMNLIDGQITASRSILPVKLIERDTTRKK